jgi:hypothetical protein
MRGRFPPLTRSPPNPTVLPARAPENEMAPTWRPFHRALHHRQSPGLGSRFTPYSGAATATPVGSGGPAHLVMRNSFWRFHPTGQVWASAWFILLASSLSCGSDRPAGPNPNTVSDSTPPPDSGAPPPDSPVPPPSEPPPPEPPPPEPPPPEPPPPDDDDRVVPVHSGLPFGPENLWRDSARIRWGPAPFTASFNYNDPGWLVKEIKLARSLNFRLLLNLTGGHHSRYKTDGKFDLAKWKARMDQYNTPEIKAAVARGVADGTIIMNSVMDEPNVPDWGGVMTKPLLDQMATYVKNMFPTLPVGVALRHDWRTEERFRVMDAFVTGYSWYKGSITAYRDAALAIAKRDGMAVAFSLIATNGGIHSWKTGACPIPLTGGHGSYKPACRMTPDQIREWGTILGTAGCGLFMYRWETPLAEPAYVQVFKDLADKLAKSPARPCRRP